MKYALIENGIVKQVQPYTQTGFIKVDETIVCGMVDNGDGTFAIPMKTPDELIAEKVGHFTAIVDRLISTEIDVYNKANYVVFTGINSLEKYNHPEAEHYAFANSMITWVTAKDVGLWATARRIQQEVVGGIIAEPTDDQFIAMLPSRA